MNVDVSVILVSYNTAGMLHECMAALRRALTSLSHEIIIVDNASRDASVALIRRDFPDCTLVENSVNVGFGRANNQALDHARGRFVLLLNTDAFVEPETIDQTVNWLRTNPEVGILGVRLTGRDGTVQPSARYFPTPLNVFLNRTGLNRFLPQVRLVDDMTWDHQAVRLCDWVPGCYYLVRREVIAQVGLFDPRYFLYYEEVDHCFAAKRAGWEVACFPHTSVIHIGGESAKSEGELTAGGRQLESMQIESELLYFRKNLGAVAVLAALALAALGDAVIVTKRLLRGLSPAGAAAAGRRALLLWSLFRRTRWATRPTR